MKHLYYLRHGESVANVEGVWSGGDNDSPLTEHGREQAKKAGQDAVAAGLLFDIIYASPMQRARDTAESIANATGYPLDKIIFIDELKERFFGELEHTNHGEAVADYYIHESGIDHYKGVEKLQDFYDRTSGALDTICARPEDTILIVCHGAVGRIFYRHLAHIPLSEKVPAYPNAKLTKLI